MILNYCDISETPAFKDLVSELTPIMGDVTNTNVYRDYMEHNGRLRDAEEILRKESSEYFTTLPTNAVVEMRNEQDANREINMTKSAMLKDLGISHPGTTISDQQLINIKKRISLKNDELLKAGVPRHYRITTKKPNQSYNLTWEIKAYRGFVNAKEKGERASNVARDKNQYPNVNLQRALDLDRETTMPWQEDRLAADVALVKFADALQQQTGVEYRIVSPQEAYSLTKNTENPWNGQSSFYYNGKVTLVSGSFGANHVIHEFGHPIIRSILKTNPALFNKLYADLDKTSDSIAIKDEVRNNYPNLDPNSDQFKEEVLVHALEYSYRAEKDGVAGSSEFQTFLNKLLYSIKQLLRSIFGKVNVSTLDASTTLQELVDMLKEGKTFDLDLDIISDGDYVAYKNDYNHYMQGIVAEKIDQKEMEKLANEYFSAISRQLNSLKTKNDLTALADIMENRFNTGELQKMKKNLTPYQTEIQENAKKLDDEVELTKQRTAAIINSLGNLSNMVNKIHLGVIELAKDVDNPDNVQRVLYFQKVLNYWQDFANQVNTALENNGVHNIKMVDEINANVRKSNEALNKFYQKASKEVLWNTLKTAAAAIDTKWETRLAELRSKNAPAEIIKKAEDSYKNERITPEMVEKALNGNLKDLNALNMYLEGYSYSPDPVVGGLAAYVKDNMNEVEANAQSRFNDAAQEFKPLLDKVNYNPNKPGELGEKLGQKEFIGRKNPETGEFEKVEVWRFINQFTGADLVRDEYRYKIRAAAEKYGETGSDADKQTLADIQHEWQQHERQFFNTKYKEPFYQLWDLLKKDDLGKELSLITSELYDDLNQLESQMYIASAEDILEIADQVEAKRRELRQISSLYDLSGKPKVGKELQMAERMTEFNQKAGEIYDSIEIPDAFQTAYKAYEQKLLDEGKKAGSLEFDELMGKWLIKNTRVVVKEEFWDKMNKVTTAIKEIMAQLPNQKAIAEEIDAAYTEIKGLIKGNRDESGQPLGTALTPERQERIKELQESINKNREKLTRMSGLTKQEQNEIDSIIAKQFTPGYRITKAEAQRLGHLMDKQAALRLDKFQRSRLHGFFAELDALRTKDPSTAYIDTVNDIIGDMDSEIVFKLFKTLSLDEISVNRLSDLDTVETLSNLSDRFKEWFLRNHILVDSVDYETNQATQRWERTYAWNVIKPRSSKDYFTTTITNLAGEKVELQSLPSMRYYKREVKPEFVNTQVVGKTVDNSGRWLPKTIEQGAADDRYQNKAYDALRKSNPNMFELLERMKGYHLKNQEGLPERNRIYLDFPRYRKQVAERLQSQNVVSRLTQRVKDAFHKVQDDFENGLNFEDNMLLVRMDLFDDNTTGVPMSGIANIPIEEVSTDIVYTTLRYMYAAEKNKQLNKIAPVARMIQQVVNDKKNYPVESKVMNNSTLFFPNKRKDKYLRAQAVNNYLEKTLEGKINVGLGSESAIAQKASNFIFRGASSAFLNLNIPSAIKNSVSMKFQGMVEAVAGKYMSPRDFIAAEGWAVNTAMKISSEIYKQGPKSLDVQLVELFDPERDRFSTHFGESMTRTGTKDYSYNILSRMTDFRKWTQLQSSLQVFNGMMRHQMVSKTDGTKIPYSEAWEVREGKIQLKAGVDPAWGVTYDAEGNIKVGEKFNQKKNEIHRVMDNLNGAMSREDRPEAERYLAYRYVSFFRRFLTAMLMNRFAYSGSLRAGTSRGRYDYQLGDTKEGYYITMLKLMLSSFKHLGKNLPYMTPEEKAASMRFGTEVGVLTLMRYLLIPLAFGWDPDDKERFKKLRAKSDALPLPWVYDDPARNFELSGWLSNHLLLQMFQIGGENDQFLPFPGYGLNDYKQMLDLKSVAFGPTVKTGFDIVNDLYLMALQDERAYYQKQANAYEWGQSGDAKILNHLAKAIGMTGTNIDPALAIKAYQSIESR